MAASGVRRQDTTKGPPLRILSLDGGGVRGYSMMIMLQELMHRTYVEMHGEAPKRHEIPKPCDHFDLIIGTGTGGLIAIMLGRLRMDVETCKDVYVRMTRRVFETDKTFAGIPFKSTLFKASKLEEAIRDCVREHTVFDDEGNDNLAMAQDLTSPVSSNTSKSAWIGPDHVPGRSASTSSRPISIGVDMRRSLGTGRWGDPNALLYDVREKRTKTYARSSPTRLLTPTDTHQGGHCHIQKESKGFTSCTSPLLRLPPRSSARVQLHNLAGRTRNISYRPCIQAHSNRPICLH